MATAALDVFCPDAIANRGLPRTITDPPLAQLGPWYPADAPRNARSIKSAERTLSLFELFSTHQRPMSVGEISRELDIPQPSVSMLVRNLTQLGYLEHNRVKRTYVPTLRIMLIGSWLHRRVSHELGLEPWLEHLVKTFGGRVLLGIQNGGYSQYIWSQSSHDPEQLDVQSGLLRPITCTAIGRALLSLKPDDEITAIVRRCNLMVEDENLRHSPSKFLEIIHEVRQVGYAQTAGDMTPGKAVLAVALPSVVGQMPMAVGLGATIRWLNARKENIVAELMAYQSRQR